MKPTVFATTVLASCLWLNNLAAAPVDDRSPRSGLTDPTPNTDPKTIKPESGTDDTKRSTDSSPIPAPDLRFVKAAGQVGLAEVAFGELALDRAQAPSVRMFAQHMVDDHGKANAGLMVMVTQRGAVAPDRMNATQQAAHKKLARLGGARFDRAYMALMVKEHKKAVADFRKQAARSKDASLRSWSAGKLPALEKHLLAASTINKDLKAGRLDSDVMQIFDMKSPDHEPGVNAPDQTKSGTSVPGQSDSATGTGPSDKAKPMGDAPPKRQ